MAKTWTIARKDIRETLRSRSTYAYLPAMLLMSTYFFFSYYGLVGALEKQDPSPETTLNASRIFLTNMAYLLPVLYSVFACNISSAALLFEKSKRSLESLLATPVSLRTVWVGKSLAATVTGVTLGLTAAFFVYVVIGLGEVLPKTHHAIAPHGLVFLNALVLLPPLMFLISMLLAYVQLLATNPRVANLAAAAVILVAWGALFFAAYYLPLKGLSINYFPLIFLGLILLLAALCALLAPRLTKEKVVLSSKG